MNIISYRGPGKGGGVSSAFTHIWNHQTFTPNAWWHVDNLKIQRLSQQSKIAQKVIDIPQKLIDGHYRFCNEFLWPIMHDMPEHATYVAHDRELYRQFNIAFASAIGKYAKAERNYQFVQDYQLALVPAILQQAFSLKSMIFWHIPWPRNVLPLHVPVLAPIASSLLCADVIGFHTQEYADNFANFVNEYLPITARLKVSNKVESLVAPLGINVERWKANAKWGTNIFDDPIFACAQGKKIILSIDRGDYTKGVQERLKTIEHFFNQYQQYIGDVTFVQICAQTRPGLASFDKYWTNCQELGNNLTNKWSQESWSPLLWIDTPVSADRLAALYSKADVMLVNPLRDGLNLTAKEFGACQLEQPGVLLLSTETGVWQELGRHSLAVNPNQIEQMADVINTALTMSNKEKSSRSAKIQNQLLGNTLSDWWSNFSFCQQTKTKFGSIR